MPQIGINKKGMDREELERVQLDSISQLLKIILIVVAVILCRNCEKMQ